MNTYEQLFGGERERAKNGSGVSLDAMRCDLGQGVRALDRWFPLRSVEKGSGPKRENENHASGLTAGGREVFKV